MCIYIYIYVYITYLAPSLKVSLFMLIYVSFLLVKMNRWYFGK